MTGRRVRAARNLIASDDVNYSLILLVWNPTKFRYVTDICASNTRQWERAWSWLREPCRSLCRNWLHLHFAHAALYTTIHATAAGYEASKVLFKKSGMHG